jgi:hypothetical protein
MISKKEKKELPTTTNCFFCISIVQLLHFTAIYKGHEFSRLNTSAIRGMNACSIISFFMPF